MPRNTHKSPSRHGRKSKANNKMTVNFGTDVIKFYIKGSSSLEIFEHQSKNYKSEDYINDHSNTSTGMIYDSSSSNWWKKGNVKTFILALIKDSSFHYGKIDKDKIDLYCIYNNKKWILYRPGVLSDSHYPIIYEQYNSIDPYWSIGLGWVEFRKGQILIGKTFVIKDNIFIIENDILYKLIYNMKYH